MPLRLIVGFEVRDEDFFTRIRGTEGCPNGHGGGLGPFCNECGQRFEHRLGTWSPTEGAVRLARRLNRGKVNETMWPTWVQDDSREPGAIVVGNVAGTRVIGVLVGAYRAGGKMSWSLERAVEYSLLCNGLMSELFGSHPESPKQFARLMLIE